MNRILTSTLLMFAAACGQPPKASRTLDAVEGAQTTFSSLECTLLPGSLGGGYFKVSGDYVIAEDGTASLHDVHVEAGRYTESGGVNVEQSGQAAILANDESYRPQSTGRWADYLRFDFAALGFDDHRLVIAQSPMTASSSYVSGALNNYRSYRYLSCRFDRDDSQA